MKNYEKIVVDTSAIIEGILSKELESKKIKVENIIIPEAILAELEHQANENSEKGFLGLDEVKKLNIYAKKNSISISFPGLRPSIFQIKNAKKGEIDASIVQIAFDEDAVLMTADKVQHLVAEAKGIQTIYLHSKISDEKIVLEQFFDETTMSVHLRENFSPMAKKGRPGSWTFEKIRLEKLSREKLREISKSLFESASSRKDGFIEIEREGSTILQIANYRIVITKPPFSDGWEITAVRPVKKLALPDYKLSQKLQDRLKEKAEGVLISGAPGQGKSTFAQALAEFYYGQGKIVKTVEAPRDLVLPEEITQLAMSHGSNDEIHDILLLTRPDYTIYDEMRNTSDFLLFSDLRLSGVGMVGVIHGTEPIDAIQRFIGRIELGVIPHVVDTVVFIKGGEVYKVFSLKMEVKVPAGMTEADLARPIVTVTDFESEQLVFEIYSYGEETVVIPVSGNKKSPLQSLAKKSVEQFFSKYSNNFEVEVVSDNKVVVYVDDSLKPRIIGTKGSNIEKIEKELGISIDIRTLTGGEFSTNVNVNSKKINYDVDISKSHIRFYTELHNKMVDILVNGEFVMKAKVSKKGQISIKKSGSPIAKLIEKAIKNNEKVEIFL